MSKAFTKTNNNNEEVVDDNMGGCDRDNTQDRKINASGLDDILKKGSTSNVTPR